MHKAMCGLAERALETAAERASRSRGRSNDSGGAIIQLGNVQKKIANVSPSGMGLRLEYGAVTERRGCKYTFQRDAGNLVNH